MRAPQRLRKALIENQPATEVNAKYVLPKTTSQLVRVGEAGNQDTGTPGGQSGELT